MYTDDRFLCRYETTGLDKQPRPTSRYGQVLQGMREAQNLGWVFVAGRGWHPLPAYQNVVYNPAIQATIATE
ncbi:hypothetical protein [Hymenobacter coccineus]|uniref:Uncharacterized protein n=1 Tax=Hymenobacter coccineus TaxID=1908235 RepID=A0A1G1TJJ5_9BACT|nr:hypothetical protein [Hymenobacter coccineus]OGX91054.1 hypothetical protein BEN49_21175 [Hymenobacter coccineus]